MPVFFRYFKPFSPNAPLRARSGQQLRTCFLDQLVASHIKTPGRLHLRPYGREEIRKPLLFRAGAELHVSFRPCEAFDVIYPVVVLDLPCGLAFCFNSRTVFTYCSHLSFHFCFAHFLKILSRESWGRPFSFIVV